MDQIFYHVPQHAVSPLTEVLQVKSKDKSYHTVKADLHLIFSLALFREENVNRNISQLTPEKIIEESKEMAKIKLSLLNSIEAFCEKCSIASGLCSEQAFSLIAKNTLGVPRALDILSVLDQLSLTDIKDLMDIEYDIVDVILFQVSYPYALNKVRLDLGNTEEELQKHISLDPLNAAQNKKVMQLDEVCRLKRRHLRQIERNIENLKILEDEFLKSKPQITKSINQEVATEVDQEVA